MATNRERRTLLEFGTHSQGFRANDSESGPAFKVHDKKWND
jgi:hypothetical protein